jgi:hypothetical protein
MVDIVCHRPCGVGQTSVVEGLVALGAGIGGSLSRCSHVAGAGSGTDDGGDEARGDRE